jgi:Family of unknown function (DUF5906)
MIKSLTDVTSVRDYLARIGAEPRSLRAAVVKQHFGNYWKDIAIIRFAKSGEVTVADEQYAPTPEEELSIRAELSQVQWPELQPLSQLINLPKQLKEADDEDVFVFRNSEGKIVMVQLRVQAKGEKVYIPFTFWSDQEWRCMEPEGALPLFNADKIKEASTVFIHEGAKAARKVQWMVDGKSAEARKALADHPWGRELAGSVHVGWTGGALSPGRTDWEIINRAGVMAAYIVADNDEPGKAAIPRISQQLQVQTFMVQFTDEFPASFDLADPFPDAMYGEVDNQKFFTGPSFRDCLHPATWATDLVQLNEKGRPTAVLRDSFKGLWSYVEDSDMFVCRSMPEIIRSEAILNKMIAPFSHVAETSRLIVKAFNGRSTRVCYRPDHAGQLVTFRGSSAINLHVPSSVIAREGSTKPWDEFLEYLFVNEKERHEAKRWIATIISRPEVRMNYGMLLVSETQGMGKTTLGSIILAPLIGHWNVSFPSENDIGSDFNEWVALKRLAVISEIYSGQNWKSYQTLKSIITDRDISVNQKYQRQYVIDNWCHILACSNSMRALKMENDDRRWFYPEIAEVPWPRSKFTEFRRWVDSGGINIVKWWADNFGDYVGPADRAPMTERKKELIEGSRSEAQREAAAIAEALVGLGRPAAITIKEVVAWCRQTVQGRVFDSDYEIRRAMQEVGLTVYSKRLKISSRMEYVMINNELRDQAQRDEDPIPGIRAAIVQCQDLMAKVM